MRPRIRLDTDIFLFFCIFGGLSLVTAWPWVARSSNISPLNIEAPLRPPKSLVALGPTIVDFASGSKVGLAAVDWDPSDDIAVDGGTGCSSGSVGTIIAADNSFLTVIFDRFAAEVGPYVRRKERAFCRLNVTLDSPGWAFDIDNIDFRGYLKLDEGVRATIKTKYKFIGQHGRGKIKTKVRGPTSQDFVLHQANDTQYQKIPRCTRNSTTLQLTLTMKIKTDDDDHYTGLVKGDAADGRFKQLLNIGWKKCTDQELADSDADNDHHDDHDSQEDKDKDRDDDSGD